MRALDLSKKELFTIAGGGQNGMRDGQGNQALMNFPYGLTQVGPMKVAMSESDNHSIRMLEITPKAIDEITPPKIDIPQKFSSTTYSMLYSVAKSSASAITETVLELVRSYNLS